MTIIKKLLNFILNHKKLFSIFAIVVLFVPFVLTVFWGTKHIDLIRLAYSDSDLLFMFQFGALSGSSLSLPLFVFLVDPFTDFLADFFVKHIIGKPE